VGTPIFPYRGAVFGFPDAVGTIPIMTNDLGVTVGAYWDAQGVQHGFVHHMIGNVFTSVDFPGAFNSWVQGINDEGIMNGPPNSMPAAIGLDSRSLAATSKTGMCRTRCRRISS
jgi:hypothetical protein